MFFLENFKNYIVHQASVLKKIPTLFIGPYISRPPYSWPSQIFRPSYGPVTIFLFDLKRLLYLYTRDCSKFDSKFKTRKSQGILLSCNSSQLTIWALTIWANKCHSCVHFRRFFGTRSLGFGHTSERLRWQVY